MAFGLFAAALSGCVAEAPSAGGAADGDIVVLLDDIRYDPDRIEVAAGEPIDLYLENVGGIVHDLVTDDFDSGEVRPGQATRVTLPPIESDIVAWCAVPGPRDAGMELTIAVTGP